MSFFEKLFGSFSDKELKRINPLKDKVLALEPEMAKLTDDELKAKTTEFKERLAKGETLDDLLPEAFAVCREADWRVLGMKPYPVQIIGGIVLHRACIAEMQTGEGKTLVATMPTYLNALTGEGVHVVTVNDYLAKRDSEWMGKLYRWLHRHRQGPERVPRQKADWCSPAQSAHRQHQSCSRCHRSWPHQSSAALQAWRSPLAAARGCLWS